jgi:hypothetical protein
MELVVITENSYWSPRSDELKDMFVDCCATAALYAMDENVEKLLYKTCVDNVK